MSDDPRKTASATRNVVDASPESIPSTARGYFVTTSATHPLVLEKDKSILPEHGVVHYPFYFGGLASCLSVCCTQPLGVAPIANARGEGFSTRNDTSIAPSLVSGGYSWPVERRMILGASLTRTVISSGIRFGMYEKLKEMSTTPTHTPTASTLVAIAAASGAAGSTCGNFADIICLRMQNDPSLPLEQRRNYRNVAHGLVRMISTEGWGSIWTGVGVGAGRAAVAAATQLAGYDIFKRELLMRTTLGDDVPVHIMASCLAGFLSTFLCSPLDVFKARVMTQKSIHSVPVMLKLLFKKEGPTWMFRGLTPALVSRGPSTIITFVTLEQFKRAYRRAHGLEE